MGEDGHSEGGSPILCLGLGVGGTGVSPQLLASELLSFSKSWWKGGSQEASFPEAGLSLGAVPQKGCDRRHSSPSTAVTPAPLPAADGEQASQHLAHRLDLRMEGQTKRSGSLGQTRGPVPSGSGHCFFGPRSSRPGWASARIWGGAVRLPSQPRRGQRGGGGLPRPASSPLLKGLFPGEQVTGAGGGCVLSARVSDHPRFSLPFSKSVHFRLAFFNHCTTFSISAKRVRIAFSYLKLLWKKPQASSSCLLDV